VLHAAAHRVAEAVTVARSTAQRRGRLRTAAEEADTTEQRLCADIDGLANEHNEVDATLSGLLRSDAYRDHEALVARREAVAGLEREAATAAEQRDKAHRHLVAAADNAHRRRIRVDGDLAGLTADLTMAAPPGHC